VLISCNSFLDAELNRSKITAEKVFSDDVTATAAVTAMYNSISGESPLGGLPNGLNALAGLSSGELSNYSQDPDLRAFELHQITAQNSSISELWNFMYTIIYQANAVLEGIHQSSTLSPSIAQQLEGEALFMRGFTYFYLVNLFGEVPLTVETDYQKNQSLPRSLVDDVYGLIKADLLLAQSRLSKQYVTKDRVRPNRATATALLARMYLYRGEYRDAETQASTIIEDESYKLADSTNIDRSFLIDSREVIWQLMPVTPFYNTIEGHYFIITTTPHNHVMTDDLLEHFEPGDFRRTHWVSSYKNYLGNFHFPFKYKQSAKEPTAPFTECSVVFRLAEILLIRAEARTYLGDVSGARADLNTLRIRSGLMETKAVDQSTLLLDIESERWSELFTEYGHRWLDLKRTGKAVDVLGNGITNDDLLYPIPAAEFIKNPNLGIQNHGY
jgi:hypothetical protein